MASSITKHPPLRGSMSVPGKLAHAPTDEGEYFLGRVAEVDSLGQPAIDLFRQTLVARRPRQFMPRLRHKDAPTRPADEQSFTFQLGVRPGDRVRIDDQLARKLP